MADVPAIDVASGQPTVVSPEAAANLHRTGKIRFAPGTRVPITWNGQSGTVLAEDLEQAQGNGAELDFDPNGAAKAAALGAARGVSLGATDWLAIEGRKLLGDEEGAERARQTLQALREDHPVASGLGEAAGALGGALVPGGAEAEGARLLHGGEEAVHGAEALGGVGEVAAQAKDAAQAAEGVQMAAEVQQAAETAKAVAQADASSGRTVGSALGSLLRHANPNNAIGAIGAGTESYLARLMGDSGLAEPVSRLARFGAEGAAAGAANAIDESELGDTELTGEALLAGMEHGALFGSTLGLVATGAERALTAAGRMASKVAEARLGGTAGQYRRALDRWGPGTLGARSLEEGIETPFATDAEKFDRSQAVVARDGQTLEGIVREADQAYGGVEAAKARDLVHGAIEQARENGRLYGGNLDALADKLKGEYDRATGWRSDPEPMEPMPPDLADRMYEAAWKRSGLPDPQTPPPPEVTKGMIRARWAEMAEAEGIGTRMERPVKRLRPDDVARFREQLVWRLAQSTDVAEKQRLGVTIMTPGAVEQRALEEANAAVAARNAQREELRIKASDELGTRYATERDAWEKVQEQHEALRAKIAKTIADKQGERDRDFAHLVSAVRRSNADLKVPLATARAFRAKLDEIIPYTRSEDALTSGAIEMKKAARRALEGHIESELDQMAQRSGNPELLGQYLHAKARYGQAKDIERMLERQRARASSRFGREVFGHYGGIIGHGLGGLVFGHPVAGMAAGIAKKYAPTFGAYLAHKVGRFAEIRALRSELLVAMRRAGRAAASGAEGTRFARLAVPDLPPHQMRATAAQAMATVAKVARDPELAARLVALDPATVVLAPRSATAMQGAARRAITWLVTQIPARITQALAQGREVDGRDLTDSEARQFMESAAVVSDPRVAADALSHGKLTPTMAAGQKAVWSMLSAQHAATVARRLQLEKSSVDLLPATRKAQLGLATGAAHVMPGMTLTLQQSAAAYANAGQSMKQPAGQVHASAGLAKMASGAALMQTMSDTMEQSSPGRRRRASGAGQ